MEILPHCFTGGAYWYTPATRQQETITIRNEDELFAAVPTHAAQLSARLQTAGQLDVSLSMVGAYRSDRFVVPMSDLGGQCEGATHIIVAFTVGAFEFSAGASDSASAGVQAMLPVAASGRATSSRDILAKAGDATRCSSTTQVDRGPPEGCGAILRLEVVPLAPPCPPYQTCAGSQQSNVAPGAPLVPMTQPGNGLQQSIGSYPMPAPATSDCHTVDWELPAGCQECLARHCGVECAACDSLPDCRMLHVCNMNCDGWPCLRGCYERVAPTARPTLTRLFGNPDVRRFEVADRFAPMCAWDHCRTSCERLWSR
jgi:hypothetical protein